MNVRPHRHGRYPRAWIVAAHSNSCEWKACKNCAHLRRQIERKSVWLPEIMRRMKDQIEDDLFKAFYVNGEPGGVFDRSTFVTTGTDAGTLKYEDLRLMMEKLEDRKGLIIVEPNALPFIKDNPSFIQLEPLDRNLFKFKPFYYS